MGIIMTFESWIIVVVRFNVLVCLFVIEALPTQRRVVRKTHGDIERCLEAGTRHCRDHCITFQGVCKNSWNTKETK